MSDKETITKKQVLECIGYHIMRWGETPPDSMVADFLGCTTQWVGKARRDIGIRKPTIDTIDIKTQQRITRACDALRRAIMKQNKQRDEVLKDVMIVLDTFQTKNETAGAVPLDEYYFFYNNGYNYLIKRGQWIEQYHLPLLLHFLLCYCVKDNKEDKPQCHIIKKNAVRFIDIVAWRDKERKKWRDLVEALQDARERMGLD